MKDKIIKILEKHAKENIDDCITDISFDTIADEILALQLLQGGVSGSAYIDGCKYCKHNKTGFDAGAWCINNCMSGNKFEHKDL